MSGTSRASRPDRERATTGSGSLSVAVIEAVAEHEGRDPSDIEESLYEVVDPDALDALSASQGVESRVAFPYHGHEVHVTSEGDVHVSDLDG